MRARISPSRHVGGGGDQFIWGNFVLRPRFFAAVVLAFVPSSVSNGRRLNWKGPLRTSGGKAALLRAMGITLLSLQAAGWAFTQSICWRNHGQMCGLRDFARRPKGPRARLSSGHKRLGCMKLPSLGIFDNSHCCHGASDYNLWVRRCAGQRFWV